MDRYLVVSADGHAGPPAEQYRDYLDERFRDEFDEHQRSLAELRELQRAARDNDEFRRSWEEETGGDGGLTAAYDSDVRNRVLDQEGVAAEVLFPDADVLGTGRIAASPFGSGLAGGAGQAPDKALAGAKAHNRWLADFVRQSPERRIGIALVPILHDIDAAVDEIRAAHDMGLRGIMIPTRWFDAPAYHDLRYEPVWEACEELGMPVHTHSGAGPADYGDGPGMLAIYTTEAYWWAARPLWVLLWSGVFERHPGLRYVCAENGAWWAPDILHKSDEKWVGGHNTAKFGDLFRQQLKMKPSDYFHRNCFLAASTPGVEDIARRHDVGIGNLLWGNDLPHPEGTFPHTRKWIRERFQDVPRDEARRILGENAVELYQLDRDDLAPIAERIGPTVDEVHGAAVS
ncbi:MAG TPA: amidohydrolase family protein [Acidimicrobiales bacterium]|nr:amidohydrolase family protein [Acidimicrobiales bacterium]